MRGCVFAFLMVAAVAAQDSRPPSVPRPAPPSDRVMGLSAVDAARVRLSGGFWGPRQELDAKVTAFHNLDECARTGRLRNFAVAAGREKGGFTGTFFDDSDVYKAVEACARVLLIREEPELKRRAAEVVTLIAAAQEKDGYLYTSRTIMDPKNPPPGGKDRWSDMAHGHELYCAGHLYEAAVAWKRATGDGTLLDVALKNAGLVESVFGRGRNPYPCGHPEIEYGLLALHDATGDARWLTLAQWFVDVRGRRESDRALFGEYAQDHKPLVDQDEAVGHAVRFAYLLGAGTEIARRTGRLDLLKASERLWSDAVWTKAYITGGIGSTGNNEGFGVRFDLPNTTAYNETCSSIAHGNWSHRLLLATGDVGYADMVERVLYNAFHSGWGLDGKTFFYPNPLASRRGAARVPWFGCACCPPNVARHVASIGGYAFAEAGRDIAIVHYMNGDAALGEGGKTRVSVDTDWPWGGNVTVTVTPPSAAVFALKLRIPGWVKGDPFPSRLYTRADRAMTIHDVDVRINGAPFDEDLKEEWITIERTWTPGDTVALKFPMPVMKVVADPRVASCRGRTALMRGPIVYAFEGIDQPGVNLEALVLDPSAPIMAKHRPELLGGVTVLETSAREAVRATDGSVTLGPPRPVTAIPYFAWANRGPSPMQVWMAADVSGAIATPLPTLASSSKASSSFGGDLGNLADRYEPTASIDHDSPYFHWWPKKGETIWVQYDFPSPKIVDGVDVYWFDDTGRGECRVPKTWRVQTRVDGVWRTIEGQSTPGVDKDRYNAVTFPACETTGLRLEIESLPGWAGGIHEWRVREAK